MVILLISWVARFALTQATLAGSGASGYIIEPRKQMAKVIATSGVSFTVHDLRRTFITIAESLDIPAYALKRLLNHKMNSDITAIRTANTIYANKEISSC